MRGHLNSKTAPRVKDGKVQKKNRWEQSPNYYYCDLSRLVIERRSPGKGYRYKEYFGFPGHRAKR
jgi:hypothetical protein